jgi:hypothetical protein
MRSRSVPRAVYFSQRWTECLVVHPALYSSARVRRLVVDRVLPSTAPSAAECWTGAGPSAGLALPVLPLLVSQCCPPALSSSLAADLVLA